VSVEDPESRPFKRFRKRLIVHTTCRSYAPNFHAILSRQRLQKGSQLVVLVSVVAKRHLRHDFESACCIEVWCGYVHLSDPRPLQGVFPFPLSLQWSAEVRLHFLESNRVGGFRGPPYPSCTPLLRILNLFKSLRMAQCNKYKTCLLVTPTISICTLPLRAHCPPCHVHVSWPPRWSHVRLRHRYRMAAMVVEGRERSFMVHCRPVA
jgi:hypothetical protein